jgi:NDP-sugar pyrophosphorylase family protein
MGIYIFRKEVLNYIEPQKHMDFPELVKGLIGNGQQVMSYPFDGYWLDIGNHSDYTKAVEEFESMKFSLNIEY